MPTSKHSESQHFFTFPHPCPAAATHSDGADQHVFYPFAHKDDEAATAGYDGDEEIPDYERDSYGERWPMCEGCCQGGKCVLDKSTSGCCYMPGGGGGSHRRHGGGYAQSVDATVASAPSYARENLVCWRGHSDRVE